MTTWIATTQDDKLADRTSDIESTNATTAADLQLDGNEYQALRGFGGCFNELGWLPLQNVSEAERDQIIKELFSPDEMNFTFNRAPVGANDFADHWYSYDEVDGDYEMEHFSVEHDEQTLIPYIHRAQEWQPNMQLFSSPWSPPTWMKRPKAYNYGRLVQTPENLKAYAKSLPYLAKSKRGFNLFEITDRSAANEGVTVGTVTDNGFGDPFNHGLRIFCDTDDYMVVGTANPFYGTQLWRVRNTQYAVNVSATEGGSASADVERAAKGSKVTLTATANKGYHFKEWNVLKGNVSIENNAFEMPDGSVSIQAVFEKDAVEPTTPTTPAKPATDTKPSTTPTGVTSTPSTGSSVLGMAVAAAVALIAGAAILLKKKQA